MDDSVKKFQQPGRTKLIKGTILNPEMAGLRFILSVINTSGKVSSPLIPIFDKRWKKVKEEIKGCYANKTGTYKLGSGYLNQIAVQSDTWVINMLCQDDKLQTDVKALAACLKEVKKLAAYEHASIHVSTLLTDAIPELKDLLVSSLIDEGIAVYFYEEK